MRSPFKSKTVQALGAILAVFNFLTSPVLAKTELEQIIDRANSQFGAIAEKDRQRLFRIIESFYESSRFTVDWSRVKNRLSITVPSNIMEYQGAHAETDTDKSGQHHLQINQIMLFRLYDQSQTTARYTIKEAFGISLDEASKSETTKQLGVAIDWTTNAWVVAHEIAHNIYRDPEIPASSFAELRQRELRADKKAFELMNNAGYSLVLLLRYMLHMDSVEQVKKRAGLLKQDAQRTHPYWSERLQGLKDYMNNHLPPSRRWVIYSILTYNTINKEIIQTMFFLPSSAVEHLGYIALVGGSLAPVGVERMSDGGVWIFIRDKDTVYKYHLSSTARYFSLMRTWQNNGQPVLMEAWRDSFEGAAAYDASNQLRNAMNLDHMQVLYSEIDKMLLATFTQQLAKTYISQRSATINDHILAYHSGQISVQEMQNRITRTTSEYDNKLRAILTPEQFSRLSTVLIKKMSELLLPN